MSYEDELAKARAMLEVPSIGVSHEATMSLLRELISQYKDEARQFLAELETDTE